MSSPEPSNTPTSPDDSFPRKPWLDWSDRDQRVLIVLAVLVFVGVAIHWARWRMRGENLVEIERLPARQYDFKVDINRATWVEWMQLPGIGEILARRIVADRKERGPFSSVEDVDRVPGVGVVTLDTIRPWLVCSDCKIVTTH
jgi:competence protein ComEA